MPFARFVHVCPAGLDGRVTDITPIVQQVVAHVRFVSFVATPEVGAATDIAFDSTVTVQQPVDSAQEDGDTGGGRRVPLTRKYPSFDYEDANFIHGAQFSYSGNRFQWTTRMTPTWQAMAAGPVHELTYWYVNGGRSGHSDHTQAADYYFHGSFDAQPGDAVDMATQFTFECVVDGKEATCRGTLYATYDIVR